MSKCGSLKIISICIVAAGCIGVVEPFFKQTVIGKEKLQHYNINDEYHGNPLHLNGNSPSDNLQEPLLLRASRPITSHSSSHLSKKFSKDSHSQAAQNYIPSFIHKVTQAGESIFPLLPSTSKYMEHVPEVDRSIEAIQQNGGSALLGSGDFGVLKGGTFYSDEETAYHFEENSDLSNYYGDIHNGHGRPANEDLIQKYTNPEEQFEYFRDFADINIPAEGAYSQLSIAYDADSSRKSYHTHPENIFQKLELLDQNKDLSKKKRPKKYRKEPVKDIKSELMQRKHNPETIDVEPLLALS